jgi:hypothetical protein
MHYKLIPLCLITTAAFAQDPLESRFYKTKSATGVDTVERYEANLDLDVKILKLYVERDANDKIVGCQKTDGTAITTDAQLDAAATVNDYKLFTTISTEDITCDSFVQTGSSKLINLIPTGFGNVSFGSFNGGAEAKATLLRYNLHYSSRGYIPFYILATTTAGGNLDTDNLKTNLFGTNSGLLNFKFADDIYTFNAKKKNGFCNFDENPFIAGGCYLNYQLGAKMLGYTKENGSTGNLVAGYTSIQLAIDLPITTQTTAGSFSRAGRLVAAAGFSAYYANTDKIQSLFPEFQDNVVGNVSDLKKSYASFDAGLKFTLTDVVDVNLSANFPLTNKDIFDNQVSVSVTWAPDS